MENINETPNYYAIIPANVRYDNELRANEKLLYGEITALASKNGECWASNEYFAKLYNVNKKTISTWISHLKERKYIEVKLVKSETTKEIEKRIINIVPTHKINDRVSIKNEIGYPSKNGEGIHQKMEENNIKNNNTSINMYTPKSKKYYGEYKNAFFTDEQYEKLLKEFPNDYGERIQRLDDYMQSTGKKYKDCLATIRMWARKENKNMTKSKNSLEKSELLERYLEEERK